MVELCGSPRGGAGPAGRRRRWRSAGEPGRLIYTAPVALAALAHLVHAPGVHFRAGRQRAASCSPTSPATSSSWCRLRRRRRTAGARSARWRRWRATCRPWPASRVEAVRIGARPDARRPPAPRWARCPGRGWPVRGRLAQRRDAGRALGPHRRRRGAGRAPRPTPGAIPSVAVLLYSGRLPRPSRGSGEAITPDRHLRRITAAALTVGAARYIPFSPAVGNRDPGHKAMSRIPNTSAASATADAAGGAFRASPATTTMMAPARAATA